MRRSLCHLLRSSRHAPFAVIALVAAVLAAPAGASASDSRPADRADLDALGDAPDVTLVSSANAFAHLAGLWVGTWRYWSLEFTVHPDGRLTNVIEDGRRHQVADTRLNEDGSFGAYAPSKYGGYGISGRLRDDGTGSGSDNRGYTWEASLRVLPDGIFIAERSASELAFRVHGGKVRTIRHGPTSGHPTWYLPTPDRDCTFRQSPRHPRHTLSERGDIEVTRCTRTTIEGRERFRHGVDSTLLPFTAGRVSDLPTPRTGTYRASHRTGMSTWELTFAVEDRTIKDLRITERSEHPSLRDHLPPPERIGGGVQRPQNDRSRTVAYGDVPIDETCTFRLSADGVPVYRTIAGAFARGALIGFCTEDGGWEIDSLPDSIVGGTDRTITFRASATG